MKHAGGRPLEYNSKYIKKAYKYLSLRQDEEIRVVRKENTGKGYVVYDRKLIVRLPTIEGFAEYIGFSKKTLYNWSKKYDDFAFALERIKTEQMTRLINEGLAGTYNPTIVKLMLSGNHGMREGIDATSGGETIGRLDDESIL